MEINLLNVARDFNDTVTEAILSKDIEVNYRSSTTFTGNFYKLMKEVLKKEPNSIREYEKQKGYDKGILYFQKERLTVDLTVWISKYDGKIVPKRKKELPERLSGYVWKYILLIEHENSGETWLHEMQKLCTIKSKYKLLITYGRNDKNGEGFIKTADNKGISLLEYANQILANSKENDNDINEFEEFIIMFG